MDIGGGTVWKRSYVVLLEQLTRLRPKIVPPDVKAEAAILAREWRAKMKMEEGQKGVLEVLGTTIDSQEKIDRSMKEELQLVNQIASSFASRLEALKYFCVGMDGRHLKLFLYQ
ncbi:hypothetical protein L484_013667 [Morus notabilis]|uniref:FRIGIDA-like protein n=1 Tax=Morus notabilis TaxID=981085 RepID=W9QMC0_9ROSA|nr:hypothetical protein L484_013667 [Morus notabilis]